MKIPTGRPAKHPVEFMMAVSTELGEVQFKDVGNRKCVTRA